MHCRVIIALSLKHKMLSWKVSENCPDVSALFFFLLQVYQAGVTKLSKRVDGSPGGSTEREAGSHHPPPPHDDRSGGKTLEVSALQQRLTELSLTDASNIGAKQKVSIVLMI